MLSFHLNWLRRVEESTRFSWRQKVKGKLFPLIISKIKWIQLFLGKVGAIFPCVVEDLTFLSPKGNPKIIFALIPPDWYTKFLFIQNKKSYSRFESSPSTDLPWKNWVRMRSWIGFETRLEMNWEEFNSIVMDMKRNKTMVWELLWRRSFQVSVPSFPSLSEYLDGRDKLMSWKEEWKGTKSKVWLEFVYFSGINWRIRIPCFPHKIL